MSRSASIDASLPVTFRIASRSPSRRVSSSPPWRSRSNKTFCVGSQSSQQAHSHCWVDRLHSDHLRGSTSRRRDLRVRLEAPTKPPQFLLVMMIPCSHRTGWPFLAAGDSVAVTLLLTCPALVRALRRVESPAVTAVDASFLAFPQKKSQNLPER